MFSPHLTTIRQYMYFSSMVSPHLTTIRQYMYFSSMFSPHLTAIDKETYDVFILPITGREHLISAPHRLLILTWVIVRAVVAFWGEREIEMTLANNAVNSHQNIVGDLTLLLVVTFFKKKTENHK